MQYEVIVKDPLLVAVFSSLIALLLAHLYGKWRQNVRRNSGLKVLRHQLENHEIVLGKLKDNLKAGHICAGLDPSPIVNFISSDVVDLALDEKLITALYVHLENIHTIERALTIKDMRSAGWTSVQNEQNTDLEFNLVSGIDECINELQDCLKLLRISRIT